MHIIKIQKLSNNRYKIKTDTEEFITFDSVILDNNLLYKNDILESELEKIKSQTNYYDIYNKVLKFCTKKLRCKSETLKYIEKFKIDNNDKNSIIKKIYDLGLLNEKKYVQAFINDKIHLSKYGIKKIEKMLLANGIDKEIINE